ncbi:MAG: 50S ribosomal protein L22, partial [Candidatus Omnitrophota bacterium]|nr:50S ribosomal protein L22 [Candidatus Omnitrophota bacterium]
FRLIIPLVKGKNPEAAIAILASVKKNAARYCEDLIQSAVANARRIRGIDVSSLYISKLTADGGPMLKRFRAASMGRASQIKKRTSHITLELDQLQSNERPEEKKGLHAEKKPNLEHPKYKSKVNVETKMAEKRASRKAVKKGKE